VNRELEHLELIPEPNEPRILTAVDPETLHDPDDEYRTLTTGWPTQRLALLHVSNRRVRPSGLLLFLTMAIVAWILLQPIYTILDDVQSPDSEWAYQNAGIRQAQQLGLTGKGVKVCIVDTGVNLNHPDLEHLKGNIIFKDFVSDSIEPVDYAEDGHGTLIVGLLAANGTLKGSAPDVEVMVASALGANEMGSDNAVADSVLWCKSKKADIISLSLGGAQDIEDPLDNLAVDAVEEALNVGIFVIAAAGNDGGLNDDGRVSVPANVPGVIAVGALNSDGTLWEKSSRGDNLAGNGDNPRSAPDEKPEITAPGVNVISTWLDGKYSSSTGTSDSTVFVTGSLALLLEKYPSLKPTWDNRDRSGCISIVKEALMESAIAFESQALPHDDRYGYGGLNAVGWIDALNGTNQC
jgi:subtilisin family serine protease